MYGGATSYADSVDNVMLYIVAISVFLLIGITVAMIYFVIKYSRKRNPKAKQIEGNITLEVIWILVPTVIVITMFWYGFRGYDRLRMTADAAQVVDVRGKMWNWDFIYDNGKETDTLYIPVGEITRLDMISLDVNHSFYIPAFRLKEDVIGSRKTFMILNPEKTGAYDVACAEYCGVDHSKMYTKVVVMPKDDFYKWKAQGVQNPDSADRANKEILEASIDTTATVADTIRTLGGPKE